MSFGFQKCRRGQSLVEFTLAVPLLAILLIGLVDFGFVLYAHVQVTNAAREAARAGSLFLGNRFFYTTSKSEKDCWSFREWVENGLVDRNRDTSKANDGCPGSGTDNTIHAFGLLAPTECSSAGAGTNCWWLTLHYEDASGKFREVTNTDLTPPSSSGAKVPVAGRQVKAELTYRYKIPFMGSYIKIFADPTVISKTVIMKAQAN